MGHPLRCASGKLSKLYPMWACAGRPTPGRTSPSEGQGVQWAWFEFHLVPEKCGQVEGGGIWESDTDGLKALSQL